MSNFHSNIPFRKRQDILELIASAIWYPSFKIILILTKKLIRQFSVFEPRSDSQHIRKRDSNRELEEDGHLCKRDFDDHGESRKRDGSRNRRRMIDPFVNKLLNLKFQVHLTNLTVAVFDGKPDDTTAIHLKTPDQSDSQDALSDEEDIPELQVTKIHVHHVNPDHVDGQEYRRRLNFDHTLLGGFWTYLYHSLGKILELILHFLI